MNNICADKYVRMHMKVCIFVCLQPRISSHGRDEMSQSVSNQHNDIVTERIHESTKACLISLGTLLSFFIHRLCCWICQNDLICAQLFLTYSRAAELDV